MRRLRVLCALFALFLSAEAAFSQAVNGTLLGTVTDATGAVVPNVRVTITETSTGTTRSGVSNESGNYTFPDLPPGSYSVSVEQTGFKRESRTGVVVEVNATAPVDLRPQPGAVTKAIEGT